MALLSVADALERVLAHAAPLPAEEAPLDRGRRPRPRLCVSRRGARSRRPTYRRWTATPCAPPMWRTHRCASRSSARSPPAGRSRARVGRRRGGAHFHRRRGAGRRRHGGDPGSTPSATATTSRCEKPSAQGPPHPRARARLHAGDTLFTAGHRLTARDLALAAGMNHPLVPVYRRPKIALFATGDELVPPGARTGGPARSSPPTTLRSRRWRARKAPKSIDLGIVARPARRYGRRDPARARMRRRHSRHHRAGLRSATTISCRRRLPPRAWNCRSGNWRCGPAVRSCTAGSAPCTCSACPAIRSRPLSAAFLFLVPLIRRLGGRSDLAHADRIGAARLRPSRERRARRLSARDAHGARGLVATPFPVQDSSMMAPLAKADCLVIREPYEPAAKAGSPCTIIRLQH